MTPNQARVVRALAKDWMRPFEVARRVGGMSRETARTTLARLYRRRLVERRDVAAVFEYRATAAGLRMAEGVEMSQEEDGSPEVIGTRDKGSVSDQIAREIRRQAEPTVEYEDGEGGDDP